MFDAGWGILLSPLTLTVTIGGTTKRVVLGESGPEERESASGRGARSLRVPDDLAATCGRID
jgi:hypothetical protein